MRKYIILNTIFLLLAAQIFPEKYNKNQILFSWVDRLSFRNKPGLQSRKIGFLAQGEPVIFTGQQSSFQTKLKLRGKLYNAYWLKVKRGSKTGWIYGGGLQKKQLKKEKILWRVIIIYCKNNEQEISEDWAWFTDDVSKACQSQGIIAIYATLNDIIDIKLGKQFLIKINMKNIMKKDWQKYCGYIFIQKGKKAHYKQHDLPDEILKSASKYFGFNIKRRNK